MHKILKILSVFILFTSLIGCESFFTLSTSSSLTDTTNTSDTTETSTTTSAIETTLTDYRHLAIEDEYASLSQNIPVALTEDSILPSPTNSLITVEYYVNEVQLIDNTLEYEKLAFDLEIKLMILLQYETVEIEKEFIIVQLHDQSLYNQAQIDLVFESALMTLQESFPKTIVSDFTLPTIEMENIQIQYSVPNGYRIFNNRFLFTFPQGQTSVDITARVTYQQQTKDYPISVTMLAFSELPKIPEIHITTTNNVPVTSKEQYVTARLTLKIFDDNLVESIPLSNASLQIRLRGNSTAYMPKLPYKLKFTTKTALLSDYAQKDWVLLANFTDQTLVRNYLSYNLARDIGMEYTPSAQFVDVYLNGVFQGNYMLTDQIEVSPNRINIEEGSSALDTGYLVEFDKRLYDFDPSQITENYFILYGIPFVIKSPSIDDTHYTPNHLYFIEDYLKTVLDTLKIKGNYSNLIDEASFIDWFIVEELFKNVDSGYSSVYMYKDKGGPLKMGPVWDFDLSTGNQGHADPYSRGPEGWYTSLEYKNIFFYYLMKYPSFKTNLKTRWNELYDTEIRTLLDKIYPITDAIAKSRYQNFMIWDVIGKNNEWYTAPEILAINTYEGQVYFLYQYLKTRMEWLNKEINKF